MTWWLESVTMAALEIRVELANDGDGEEKSEDLEFQMKIQSAFASRYSRLKSSAQIPLVKLWTYSSQTRGKYC